MLVLMKVQSTRVQVWVKFAVGGVLTVGTGETVIVLVSTSVAPSLSITVRVTEKSVAVVALSSTQRAVDGPASDLLAALQAPGAVPNDGQLATP